MKYIFLLPIVNIIVNISLRYARESSIFSFSIANINILAYCSFLGFIFSFVLYSKASKVVPVSILFPLTKGIAIAGTVIVEYFLFSSNISFVSLIGIVSIIIGAMLLSPQSKEETKKS